MKYYAIQFKNNEFYLQLYPTREMAKHQMEFFNITESKVVEVEIKVRQVRKVRKV